MSIVYRIITISGIILWLVLSIYWYFKCFKPLREINKVKEQEKQTKLYGREIKMTLREFMDSLVFNGTKVVVYASVSNSKEFERVYVATDTENSSGVVTCEYTNNWHERMFDEAYHVYAIETSIINNSPIILITVYIKEG